MSVIHHNPPPRATSLEFDKKVAAIEVLYINALRTLTAEVNALCRRYKFKQVDIRTLYSDCGTPVVVWACGKAPKDEGEPIKLFSSDPAELVPFMLNTIDKEAEKAYKRGQTTLLWRRRPAFGFNHHLGFNNECVFYHQLTARFAFE